MRAILRQLMMLFAAITAAYALLLTISLMIMPVESASIGLDTSRATHSLYMTEPKYVFLSRSTLQTPRDRILLLGASNVVAGFRQSELQQLLHGQEVDKLAVGGSNVTQVAQIVDLVHEVQGTEARRHNTFVIGLWYGLFADDRERWYTPDRHAGDTDIDIERYRYGFFHRSDEGPVAMLPPRWLSAATVLIHPMLVIDRVARDATNSLRQRLAGKTDALTEAQRNAIQVSPNEQQRYLAFWADYMGGGGRLPDAQFMALDRLVNEITRNGGRVILLDLPIPSWHAQSSPYEADYRLRMAKLFVHLSGRPNVVVMPLATNDTDMDFSDEVHPKPRVAQRWTTWLADALRALPCDPSDTPTVLAASDTRSTQR